MAVRTMRIFTSVAVAGGMLVPSCPSAMGTFAPEADRRAPRSVKAFTESKPCCVTASARLMRNTCGAVSVSSMAIDVPDQPMSTSFATPYGSPGVHAPSLFMSRNAAKMFLPSRR